MSAHEEGMRIRAAIEKVLTAGKDLTPDLGGAGTTSSMGKAIEAAL